MPQKSPKQVARMDDNSLRILEYKGLLGMLAEKALSDPGAEAALELKPDLSPEEVLFSWSLTEEAKEIISQKGLPDIGGHLEISHFLEHLTRPGALLGPEELRLVGQEAQAIKLVREFFKGLEALAPQLFELASGLVIETDLIDRLHRSIGPEGEILDTASPALGRLRADQTATRQGLIGKLSSLIHTPRFKHIIQDDLVTDRSGRFVVPVKASGLHNAPGMVLDWSQSEATAFLEPMEVVADNNKLGLIRRREKEEIERILADLSQRCSMAAPGLLAGGKILTTLDLYFAKALLAKAQGAITPEYKPGEGVDLKEARHPILARRLSLSGGRMTPLDIKLSPAEPLLVVSGLNTGGKTVALKTLGIITLMAKTGLMVPVKEGSRLDLFNGLLVVIGDEQDLSADLSTFSGHVKSLIKILANVGPETLVLLDELGSGTDPAEGSALALAILSRLLETGAYVISATHYQQVKAWAMVTDRVVIAAVNTGADGRPAYGLSYGRPGFSGGLAMARRLGLNEELVKLAESFLDDGQRETNALLAKLDAERGALTEAKEEYWRKNLTMAQAEAELRNERRRITQEHNQNSAKLGREVKNALAKAEAEFNNLKAELKKASAGNLSWENKRVAWDIKKSQAIKELKSTLPAALIDDTPLKEIKAGDRVLVKKLGRVGRVVKIEKNEAQIEADGLNIKARLNDLYKAPAESKKAEKYFNLTVTTSDLAPSSLNLIGKTVEEAIMAIEKSLDQASLAGGANLSIIHGLGTGRLRQAVRGFLKGHPLVKSFKGAEGRGGGEGVTEVELFN